MKTQRSIQSGVRSGVKWMTLTALGLSGCTAPSSSFSVLPPPAKLTTAAPIVPTQYVCDPFSQGGTLLGETNGLQATLTYLPRTSNLTRSPDSLSVASFAPSSLDVVTSPATLFLSKLYVPTSDFTQGFKDNSGKGLTSTTGELLTEFFALHIDSQIVLNENDPEGDYQFGVLSDDGSILSIGASENSLSTWINNDGTHSNRLGCAKQTVHLRPADPITIHLDYYQGPAMSISLVLLWRLNPSAALLANDSASKCGVALSDNYFFDSSATPPTPKAPWTTLTSHSLHSNPVAGNGWQVVPDKNFYLPTGYVNPCKTH